MNPKVFKPRTVIPLPFDGVAGTPPLGPGIAPPVPPVPAGLGTSSSPRDMLDVERRAGVEMSVSD